MTQQQFTIQTLLGETFQVSIPLTQAENIFLDNTSPYHYYGLDYLKDAISIHTGNDPVSQQLICQEELTIQTPLLPLVDTVITLIVKPPLTIEFIHTPTPVVYLLQGHINTDEAQSIVCYLLRRLSPLILNLRVIGQKRNYFKIATADLKAVKHIALRKSKFPLSKPYLITVTTPTYVWIQFDKDNMKIVD